MLDQETIRDLRKKFRKGNLHWSAKTLPARVQSVKDQWPDDGAGLEFFGDLPNKIDNLWLHPSPFGLKASVERTDTGLSFTYGPSGFYVEQALFSGCWEIGQIVTLVFAQATPRGMLQLTFEKKALGPACARFIVLTDEEMKAGRNDPCPCASGLKFKHCHGG